MVTGFKRTQFSTDESAARWYQCTDQRSFVLLPNPPIPNQVTHCVRARPARPEPLRLSPGSTSTRFPVQNLLAVRLGGLVQFSSFIVHKGKCVFGFTIRHTQGHQHNTTIYIKHKSKTITFPCTYAQPTYPPLLIFITSQHFKFECQSAQMKLQSTGQHENISIERVVMR